VNGRVAYDKANDTLYRHIRPREDTEIEPVEDLWPRRLGAPWGEHLRADDEHEPETDG